MDINTDIATSLYQSFRKCGEITAALKVDRKTYVFNCGFCSRVFIELHAFTVHIDENHEQELFQGSLDESCEELLPVDGEKDDILSECNEAENAAVEHFYTNEIKEEETAIDFQDLLVQPSLNVISKEMFDILEVKEELEVVHEGNGDYGKKCMDKNNGKEDEFDSSETEISSVRYNEQLQVNAKELTRAIISGFEKHRILWDANDSRSKNRRQLIDAHKSIANSINEQLMTNLNWTYISDRIKKLCHKFRLELQNQKTAKSKGEDYAPKWYYDELIFLNTGTKYRRKKVKMELESELREHELPLPNLTDAKNLELIDIYKSIPCLWNMDHIEYRVTNRRQDAINEMIQEIRIKLDLNLTEDELQKKINCIRDAYSHETHRKLKCERLNKKFTPFYKFYEKISFLENNVSPFKCDNCEETFDGFSRYKVHKSQHDGTMPFSCMICSHGFMDVSNYAVHMRRHAGDFSFECEICKKRFAVNDDVKIHMRCHTGEKPYFCEVCGLSFRTCSSLNVHMRRHKNKPNHNCSICSKSFYEKFRLTAHMKAHLNIRDKVCNICGKAFTAQKYLRQHKQIHADKKEHVCKICAKDFAQRAGLHGHMKSHGTTVTGM